MKKRIQGHEAACAKPNHPENIAIEPRRRYFGLMPVFAAAYDTAPATSGENDVPSSTAAAGRMRRVAERKT